MVDDPNAILSLREKFLRSHPEFPLLRVSDPGQIQQFLANRGWLQDGEIVQSAEKAGEGNMNLTLRVETGRGSMILKQSRPWVEKYDHIAAPWDRILSEQRFYERAAKIPAAARMMPRLFRVDPEARVLVFEDLDPAEDLSSLYGGGKIEAREIDALAEYLAAVHRATRGIPDPELDNREMRALNHRHIHEIPLMVDNGLNLDNFEFGLTDAAQRLRGDRDFCKKVEQTGRRYLAEGPCLVHGDFFPGSWMRTAEGVKVIDPEFCFHGDPEFDLGVCIAHFALSGQPMEFAHRFLDTYQSFPTPMSGSPAPLAKNWIARFAACEIMRRLIGVAQLPIPASRGLRAMLLEKSRQMMAKETLEPLGAID